MANICVTVAYGFIIIGFMSIIFVYDDLGKNKNSHNKKNHKLIKINVFACMILTL